MKHVEERIIEDYLLGTLPEAEMERLDQLSVTDDDFAQRLRDVENDLMDAYVRGELSGNTLVSFKSHYLASSKRKEKVSFAEAFRDVMIASEQATIKSISRKPAFVFQWALAAVAAMMMLTGGYLMFDNMSLRNQRLTLEQRERDLLRELALQRSSDAEKEKELTRVRQRLAELEKKMPFVEQRGVRVIALNLRPQTRNIGQIPVLSMPADTDSVDITLELEMNEFSAYAVALKNPATDEVLWNDKLKADKSIKIRLPAHLLKSQNYVLELSGISSGGVSEIISSYPFRVIAQ
ncbi:hypothetical protein L0222_05940 [bacterium]|nr:hypothetical protein [bacterium]MCI0602523.1 hypothetical protein [bacterium]